MASKSSSRHSPKAGFASPSADRVSRRRTRRHDLWRSVCLRARTPGDGRVSTGSGGGPVACCARPWPTGDPREEGPRVAGRHRWAGCAWDHGRGRMQGWGRGGCRGPFSVSPRDGEALQRETFAQPGLTGTRVAGFDGPLVVERVPLISIFSRGEEARPPGPTPACPRAVVQRSQRAERSAAKMSAAGSAGGTPRRIMRACPANLSK